MMAKAEVLLGDTVSQITIKDVTYEASYYGRWYIAGAGKHGKPAFVGEQLRQRLDAIYMKATEAGGKHDS